MARLACLALLAVPACGGPIEVALPTPLLVVYTYPASGATVERDHVQTVSVTFSEDLGDTARPTGQVVDKIRLLRHGPQDDLATPGEPVDLGAPTYRPENFTVEFTPDRRVMIAATPPGTVFTLLVGAGLQAASGATLPVDVRVVFWIGAATEGKGEGEGEGEGEGGQ